MGLAVCYQIVQRHHGQIKVISEIGQGTEVAISLPLTQPSDQAIESLGLPHDTPKPK